MITPIETIFVETTKISCNGDRDSAHPRVFLIVSQKGFVDCPYCGVRYTLRDNPVNSSQRFSGDAGIAIGPILFVIALLAILAAVMASGNGDYQVASGADRITADIVAQANLIRNTINECNLQYTLAVSSATVTGSFAPTSNPYPATPVSGLVSDLVCTPTTGTSLWGAILLPPPTSGFSAWNYINAYSTGGGRCFWTAPNASSESEVAGLTRAASKFNSSTSYSSSSEVIYNPSSASQKFIVWVTLPTGSANSNCLP